MKLFKIKPAPQGQLGGAGNWTNWTVRGRTLEAQCRNLMQITELCQGDDYDLDEIYSMDYRKKDCSNSRF